MMNDLQHQKMDLTKHPVTASVSARDGGRFDQSGEKARIQCCYRPYGWLRIPSMLLVCVGVLGILSSRVEAVAEALSFLNTPPEIASYGVVLGAFLLFGFSLISQRRQTEITVGTSAAEAGREHWRSI